MIKSYESMIIAKSDSTEKDIQTIIDKITAIVESNNGKITKVDRLGNKKLAYEIKKNKEGYYICIEFLAEDTAIAEIERVYRITENIIKFLTVKKEDES